MRTLVTRAVGCFAILLSPVLMVASGLADDAFATPTYQRLPDPCPAPTHPLLHPWGLAKAAGTIDGSNRRDRGRAGRSSAPNWSSRYPGFTTSPPFSAWRTGVTDGCHRFAWSRAS